MIPAIHLKTNNSEWKMASLKECLEPLHSGTLTQNQLVSDGKYPVINGGREDYGRYNSYNCENALTISSRGEAGHVRYVSGKFWAGGLCYPYKAKNGATAFFAQSLMAHENEIVQLYRSQTSIPAVNKSDIEQYEINYPELSVQSRIAAFLSALDTKIEKENETVEKLKAIKQTMLQKMFPKEGERVPEIRFPGFTGDWEQRKLGEIATFINGRAYSQSELLSEGKYKVLRVGNFYTNDSWYYSDLELGDKYYANYGDLLYTWSATFGPHIWLGDKVIYHYHIWKVNLSEQLEKRFAVQLLEQDKANILSNKNGSTMVHVTKEGMEQKDVVIPVDTKEQAAIGAFFEQLDNLITLHQRKVKKLYQLKNSLLNKLIL